MGILKLYRGGQIALNKDYIHLNSHLEGIGEPVSYILANSGGTKPLAFATCMSRTSCSDSVSRRLLSFRAFLSVSLMLSALCNFGCDIFIDFVFLNFKEEFWFLIF